jgi:heterodisulfide reductase subunit B
VAAETGHTYGGGVKVQHLLDVILERAGLAKVAARVKRPLENLRVACYYGCLMTRPAKVVRDARPEYPERMDELLRALGAEPVAWSSKTECCGNSLSLTRPPLALQMSRKILDNASECGAEAVVTMCPFCHTNLDARQLQMDLEHPRPVLYATQLMTLAFGMGAKAALLENNFVDPRPLLLRRKLLD